jgi:hypothetical protein
MKQLKNQQKNNWLALCMLDDVCLKTAAGSRMTGAGRPVSEARCWMTTSAATALCTNFCYLLLKHLTSNASCLTNSQFTILNSEFFIHLFNTLAGSQKSILQGKTFFSRLFVLLFGFFGFAQCK